MLTGSRSRDDDVSCAGGINIHDTFACSREIRIVESIIAILKKLSDEEVKAFKKRNEGKFGKVVPWLTGAAIIAFIAALAVAVIPSLRGISWLSNASYVTLVASYAVFVLSPLLPAISLAIRFRREKSIGLLLDNARLIAVAAERGYAELMAFDLDTLRLAKYAVEGEAKAFEARTSLVVGSVEKVGLLPGILALAYAHTALPSPQLSGFGYFVNIVAWANPILFFVAIAMQPTRWRLERYGKLLEMALDAKKSIPPAIATSWPPSSLTVAAQQSRSRLAFLAKWLRFP